MRTSSGTAPRTWFITGASRGLGRAFAEAALDRGDRVVAAARTIAQDDFDERHGDRLLALTLDVTDRAAVFAAVATAVEHFGRLDIVVNNAGTMSMGMIEEFTEAEARAQFEVNLFGALWVSQAVLPHLRAQRSGHIVQISSIAALGGFPSTGMYSASKFALEGMSEALAMEAAAFDVKLSIVQPGGYWTDLYTSITATTPIEAYAPLRAELERQWAEGSIDSEPRLAAEALLRLVDSDDPPLRLLLGSMVYDLAFDISAGGWTPGRAGNRSAAPPSTRSRRPERPVRARTSAPPPASRSCASRPRRPSAAGDGSRAVRPARRWRPSPAAPPAPAEVPQSQRHLDTLRRRGVEHQAEAPPARARASPARAARPPRPGRTVAGRRVDVQREQPDRPLRRDPQPQRPLVAAGWRRTAPRRFGAGRFADGSRAGPQLAVAEPGEVVGRPSPPSHVADPSTAAGHPRG